MRGLWGVVGLTLTIVIVAAVALAVALGSSSTAIADLELGDCFDFPDPLGQAGDRSVEVVEQVDVIDCDGPHDVQVVLVGELRPDGDLAYPADAELFDLLDRRCSEAASLVGDEFGLLPLAPTERSWNERNGRFHCLAVQYGGGQWEGTLLPSDLSG